MGAWKQFTTKDVTLTPFTADKGWNLTGSSITSSDYGANIFYGLDVNYTASANIQSGFVYSSSVNSIFNSAKQLYYTNYRTSSTGDYLTTASVIRGFTPEDDVLTGPINSPLFDNSLESSLTQYRYFPGNNQNELNEIAISVISIPTKLFGEKIMPYTFEFKFSSSSALPIFKDGVTILDDGEGNLYDSTSTSKVVGNIFYSQGVVTLTTGSYAEIGNNINTFFTLSLDTVQINYSSSLTIYEQQYKCTVLENEFGISLNPSLLTASIEGSNNEYYYPFATASYFEPYITCVGLYNEAQQLVAVGKLSFPLPVSQFTDTTVIVNYDIW